MKKFVWTIAICGGFWLTGSGQSSLEKGFDSPPLEARTRAYWWWLNGNVTKEAITRDLVEMRAKGWGGALICDAGGAEQHGNGRVPHGPTFFSKEWRELYRHALREASRLGLEMSLNIQSGWNLGGPMVPKEDAVKAIVWSEAVVTGGSNVFVTLPNPPRRHDFYRDLFVVAYRVKSAAGGRSPLKNWRVKALHEKIKIEGPDGWFLQNSAPDTAALLDLEPSVPGEEDAVVSDVLDVTGHLGSNGEFRWNAPPGEWQVLRFGCTLAEINQVSTSSDGWKGYALDVLDEAAFKRYWDAIVEPLIADAGPLAGTTLKYLHTDSWETGVHNWTPRLREEFRERRGYDFLPWLPVIAGKIVNSREESHRFLHDFRRTLGDLVIDRHYRPYSEWAARHGLGIHPESGGPHFVPLDAQRALGMNDIPMSEFWAMAATHRRSDQTRFFVKQPASAAHVYGRKLVAAEGFTTVGPHWQETLWDNLKPSFDQACLEGLNRLVWHAFVCSPKEMGMPGQQYFAGTHMNPNVTWWEKSGPFINYLNRCQFMLQQGLFVADVLYYYGDHVPNYTQLRRSDPAKVGPGYDYDVIPEDALLTRVTVKDRRLTLPDGMSYRILVLPQRDAISLKVLEKIQQLATDGATIIMTRPEKATGLSGFPESDARVQQLADQLFGETRFNGPLERTVGLGRVISGKTAREVLLADGVKPDFESAGGSGDANVNYIHRRDGEADIYFVASRSGQPERVILTFRVSGRVPEFWDAVSGEMREAAAYRDEGERITVPVNLPPYGSMFVVFRKPTSSVPPLAASNEVTFEELHNVAGSWRVSFDSKWGGPSNVTFDQLVSWADRPEPGIKYFSGTAVYRKTFTMSDGFAGKSVWLDLGDVRELAEVKVNGNSCGIVWAPPFRVEITHALKPGLNQLSVEVVNFWPNRVIGDASLPQERRLTRTNIRRLTPSTPLMKSGLFGPVRLVERVESTRSQSTSTETGGVLNASR